MEALEFLKQKYDLGDCDNDGKILVHPVRLIMWLNEFHLIQEEANTSNPINNDLHIPDVNHRHSIFFSEQPENFYGGG